MTLLPPGDKRPVTFLSGEYRSPPAGSHSGQGPGSWGRRQRPSFPKPPTLPTAPGGGPGGWRWLRRDLIGSSSPLVTHLTSWGPWHVANGRSHSLSLDTYCKDCPCPYGVLEASPDYTSSPEVHHGRGKGGKESTYESSHNTGFIHSSIHLFSSIQ